MELIKITDKFVTLNSEPYNDVSIWQGKTYLLKRGHAQSIAGLGLGKIMKGSEHLRHFSQEALVYHSSPIKVLFLFDGGLGDAISLAILFNALRSKYNITANIACKKEVWRDILKPLGFSGKWYPLPVELDIINVHDYIQTRADIFFKDKPEKWNLCIVDEFCDVYKVDLVADAIHYSIPEKIIKSSILHETNGIRIGVNFDSKGRIRSYPEELQPILLSLLSHIGFEIFILGVEAPNLPVMSGDNSIHVFSGKTTVPELASIIQQMDIMLCVDSFIAHFSNAMGIETITLLSTTRKGIYSWHKHVYCLESKIECSPCGEVANSCPAGLDQCKAFFHESISPEVILYSVVNQCACHFDRLIQTSIGGKG